MILRTLISSLGLYYFGYNIVIVGVLQESILQHPDSPSQSICSAIFFLGCTVSPLLSGYLLSKGTKRTVCIVNALVAAVAMPMVM